MKTHSKIYNCIYFFIILLLWTTTANGQTNTSSNNSLLSENEFFDAIPSVATVTRLPTPKAETPAAVTIIDQDIIKATGTRDLVDLFRLIPGFQVSSPRAHRPAVTYHGLGDQYSRRMQILIDGRSTYGSLFGHVSWSTQGIVIEDIERIEVVRGPNSVSYGANAFLGTINIITKHSAQQTGTTFKLTGGNNGVRDVLARYSTPLTNGNMRITTAYKSDDGLKDLYDDSHIRMINLRADLQTQAKDKILFQTSFSNTDHGENNNPEVMANTKAHYQQLRWQRDFTDDNQLSLQVYHNSRDLDYDYLANPINLGPIFGVVQLPVDFDGISTRYDVELQHTLSHWEHLRLVWGAGSRYDKVESNAYFVNEGSAKTQSSRLFGNIEWRANESIIINAGGMWEDSDFSGTDFSPRLALNYAVSPKQTLRTVWSKAKRIPSLFEEKGNYRFATENFIFDQTFASQGGLDAETITSYEIGYFGQYPKINTTLDFRIYRDHIEDLIGIETIIAADLFDNLAGSYRNEGEITIDGIDFEARYRPTRKTQLAITYAFMDASATTISDDLLATKQLREDSVPEYSGSLFLMHQFKGDWEASTGFYWVDSMRWLDSSDTADSYQRLDLRIAKKLRLYSKRGTIALTIQNIGEDYADYNNRFFERRTFISFNLDY